MTRFQLDGSLTPEQLAFFAANGFLHFEGFASATEIAGLVAAMDQLSLRLCAERRRTVNGIPIRYGRDVDGRAIVQRFAFTSELSGAFAEFVNQPKFAPIKALIGEGCRVGEHEKDGVVVNHWVNANGSRYRQLGWHTDGLRDIFLHLRKPGPMLNVGVYLDDSPPDKGGLRLIPGSHRQSLWSMMFDKLYFLDHRPDPREIRIDAKAGDLTIHDGRLWHRVARAAATGAASRRRILYVPFVSGPYQPKNAASPTPIYHRLQWLVR